MRLDAPASLRQEVVIDERETQGPAETPREKAPNGAGAMSARSGPAPSSLAPLLRGTPEQVLGRASSPRERRRLMVALQHSAGNSAVNRLLRQLAPPAQSTSEPGFDASAAAGARLVADDGPAPDGGQMRVSNFFAQLGPALCAVAQAGLGDAGQSCPWIDYWIASYRDREPAEIEQVLTQYAPASADATTAQDLIQAVCDRVSQGITSWQQTGEMGVDVPGTDSSSLSSTLTPRVALKRRDGGAPHAGAVDAEEVISRLGAGRPLDTRVAVRMGSALGADFGDVRLHDDAAAARTTESLGARALAVGQHIAFAPNRYAPGTAIGDALIAHELAHVVQQSEPGRLARAADSEARLELDADTAAVSALDVLHGGPPGARGLRPALRAGLRLQRCPGSSPAPAPSASPPAPAPPIVVAAGRNQRVGTGELTTAQLHDIQNEVFPAAAPSPGTTAPRLWDGRTGATNAVAHRKQLKKQMLKAMNKFLDDQMVSINPMASGAVPHTTVGSLAGAGKSAKRHVDAMFGEYASAAALTAPQVHVRGSFTMRPGIDLIDRTDPTQFATDPSDLADWIAQTAPDAQAAQTAHALVKDRSAEERDWLAHEVVAPFTTARNHDLDLFDRFGFFDTTRRRITILPTLASGGSNAAVASGAPSEALRRQQWATWQLLVHEYIHTLEHPTFQAARGGNRVLFEGFCEYFALQVKRHWVPIIKADVDQTTRIEVEGADAAGHAWPGFDPNWIGTPDPGAYAAYVTHTEAIRDKIGHGGEEALRGAFFQGHIELIGLQPSGSIATTALHLTDDVHVPAGITDRATLAVAANVPEADIIHDNPALPAAGLTAGAPVRIVGTSEHIVVQADPTSDVPTGSPTPETPGQIATQNGITEAALRRANPGVNWATLSPGDRVFIPRH